jgi:hypothetical protein
MAGLIVCCTYSWSGYQPLKHDSLNEGRLTSVAF